MPIPFEDKTVKYVFEDTDMNGEKVGDYKPAFGHTNPETWKFMKDRYVVLRNFIPKDILTFALDTWKTIEHNEDLFDKVMRRENDITHNSPESSLRKSHGAPNTPMGVAMGRWLRDALDSKLDLHLRETYTYARKYERGAYLKAHIDRISCEVSATYCLDYQTDDGKPWKIWLKNDRNYAGDYDMEEMFEQTQGLPPRKRDDACKCLELYPGDVLIYQGPNIPHWRDTFVGDFSYHMFSHFHNVDGGIRRFCESTNSLMNRIGKDTVDPAALHIAVEYDGRDNRYQRVGPDDIRMQFDELLQKWDSLSAKEQQFWCNNFDNFNEVKD